MEIVQKLESGKMVFSLKGRLDTVTSPELQNALSLLTDDDKDVVLDFTDLEYISSAGLRVLLTTHKKIASVGGAFSIKGVNESVREVFDMTGFSDILTLV